MNQVRNYMCYAISYRGENYSYKYRLCGGV